MARYGQAFKDRAVARLLPPESASIGEVSLQVGVAAATPTCARSSLSEEALVASEIIRRRYDWHNAGYSLIKFLLTRVIPRLSQSSA